MVGSATGVRGRYLKFFAWSAVIATILVLGFFGMEVLLPPETTPPYASAASSGEGMGFDAHDLQVLAMVASLVVAFASYIGLGITGMLNSLDARKERIEAARWAGLTGRASQRTPEPANDRLRALREVVSTLEETPARKT